MTTQPKDVTQIAARSRVLYAEHSTSIAAHNDRLFACLLIAQWIAGISIALVVSPRAWDGALSSTHPHVWGAVFLGGLVASLPAALGWLRPGQIVTRHAIAIGQMGMGALFIHLTGGRIETHFHVFGSLAFLAMYRDWRVLVTGSLVVALDHVFRGILWPASVYGVLSTSNWRWVEHAWWVVFEDVFLIASCVAGRREMWSIATRHAELEAQAELERSIAQARSANQAKSEFLANMSHEIRTPMTAIQGYADLMLDHGLDASDRLNYVQIIRRNSSHLLSIINDILDISKIEAGKMTVENISCSPAQILVEVASLMRVRAVEKGLDFDIRFETAMPRSIGSDPTRLRQILMNLTGNAIKFTQKGSVRLIARCHDADAPTARVSFEVADTGLGLTKEQEQSLFAPFAQADSSTTRRFGGTGLGLVICRRLAHLLGGDISVDSLAGRGSSFTVTVAAGSLAGVPMIEHLHEAGIPAALSPTPALTLLQPTSILLAEDGLDNQLLIATHLRKAGAQVTIAENGRIAVESALAAQQEGRPFDLILMDMQMPELDGYGATAKLRSKGYKLPIVALTAHAMTGDRERCLQAGCDDYMTKPIERAALLTMVARHSGAAKVAAPTAPTLVSIAPTVTSASVVVTPLHSEFATDPDMSALIEHFVQGLGARRAALVEAARAVDIEPLRRLAHQLKGAAGGFGFPSITHAAAAVEVATDHAEPQAVLGARVEELAHLIDRAIAGIATETDQHNAQRRAV